MKTMQDFKNEESRRKYAILKKELNKYGPIGKLVKHRYFDKEEWVTKCTNGLYYFEDGINFTEEEFLLWADKPYFKEGWEIIPNPERSVG